MKHLHLPLCVFAAVTLVAGNLDASKWPQRRGPNQDGVSNEKLNVASWGNQGPEVLWRADVGTGVSSMIAADGKVFAFGNESNEDRVAALDAKTGKQLWEFSYECPLDPRQFTGGTASSPLYDDGLLYTLSHRGDLYAFNADDGKVVWQKHLVKDLGGKRPGWGYAQSPVITGDKLIVVPGGTEKGKNTMGSDGAGVVALNKKTGETIWSVGDNLAGYGTPLIYDGGSKVAIFNAWGLSGLDTATGKELYTERWKTAYQVNAATPIVSDDKIFISSGYGTGSGLFKLTGSGATKDWTSKDFQTQMTNAVLFDGTLYGFSMHHVSKPAGRSFRAVDFDTGKVLWETKDPNMGALIVVDGKLVIQSDGGELIIAEADPKEFKEITRFQLLGGKNWVTPAIADGVLYLRNNAGKVVAVKAS
ncbi:MAG: PQQ-binding-like beta-propeller repeat protein [Verrucomicrobiota bacterium]